MRASAAPGPATAAGLERLVWRRTAAVDSADRSVGDLGQLQHLADGEMVRIGQMVVACNRVRVPASPHHISEITERLSPSATIIS